MAAAYSLDLRQRVIEAYTNEEGSMRQLSRRFNSIIKFLALDFFDYPIINRLNGIA